MNNLSLLAQALRYPYPGQIDALHTQTASLNGQPGSKTFAKFLAKVQPLSISEQEVLYTRTLDLSPLAAPYVGYHIWGESYTRGEFMSNLNHEMKALNLDLEGELPDHLRPILLYLEASPTPLPELIEVLDRAIKSMQKTLKKVEADNPYLLLFEAVGAACKALPVAA